MSRHSAFINDAGTLRSGWRFAVFIVVYPLFWIASALLLYLLLRNTTGFFAFLFDLGVNVDLALNVLARFLAAVAALLFVSRFVERKPASTFIGFGGWLRNLAIGLAGGTLLVLLLLVGLTLFGAARVRWDPASAVPIVFAVCTFFIGAAHEELLFRGYPMQSLAEGMGNWPAAAVMSILFGMVHLGNPHASGIGIMNTIIAGLLLSVSFFKVRSLWLPFGIHVAWNVGIGIVLGFSVSGIDLGSLWKSTADGSPALTGAFYGPEGGLLCTLVLLAGLAATKYIRTRSAVTQE